MAAPGLDLPAELRAAGIALRPQEAGDRAFLETLYRSVRAEELALTDWPEEIQIAFVRQQFEAQSRHYAAHYAGASFDVVEQAGVPIGRLYLHRGDGDIRLVDISILPGHRGAGLGRALLKALQAAAAAEGRTVSLHVFGENRAQRLYRRLGFRRNGKAQGAYRMMVWGADGRRSATTVS